MDGGNQYEGVAGVIRVLASCFLSSTGAILIVIHYIGFHLHSGMEGSKQYATI